MPILFPLSNLNVTPGNQGVAPLLGFTTNILPTAAPVSYTLTATVGAFTETGNAANLLYGRKLTSSVGTFSETGMAASLRVGRTLSAVKGTFVETGNAVTFGYSRKVVATTGAFTLTGNNASLTASGGGTAPLIRPFVNPLLKLPFAAVLLKRKPKRV